MLHGLPQLPQLFGSKLTFVSQPFARLPSQFANPVRHDKLQTPELHDGVAFMVLHAVSQRPQWAGSFAVFTHTALLPVPQRVVFGAVVHDWPQTGGVPLQVGMPPAGVGQIAHDVPQELVELEVSGTQVPLQS